jgi:hypothetical protein
MRRFLHSSDPFIGLTSTSEAEHGFVALQVLIRLRTLPLSLIFLHLPVKKCDSPTFLRLWIVLLSLDEVVDVFEHEEFKGAWVHDVA